MEQKKKTMGCILIIIPIAHTNYKARSTHHKTIFEEDLLFRDIAPHLTIVLKESYEQRIIQDLIFRSVILEIID